MGMQIIGRSGDDAGVLAIGQAWHRATEWPQRHPPLVAGAVSR
jgi:amidase